MKLRLLFQVTYRLNDYRTGITPKRNCPQDPSFIFLCKATEDHGLKINRRKKVENFIRKLSDIRYLDHFRYFTPDERNKVCRYVPILSHNFAILLAPSLSISVFSCDTDVYKFSRIIERFYLFFTFFIFNFFINLNDFTIPNKFMFLISCNVTGPRFDSS